MKNWQNFFSSAPGWMLWGYAENFRQSRQMGVSKDLAHHFAHCAFGISEKDQSYTVCVSDEYSK